VYRRKVCLDLKGEDNPTLAHKKREENNCASKV